MRKSLNRSVSPVERNNSRWVILLLVIFVAISLFNLGLYLMNSDEASSTTGQVIDTFGDDPRSEPENQGVVALQIIEPPEDYSGQEVFH
jgi:hypothetical protein